MIEALSALGSVSVSPRAAAAEGVNGAGAAGFMDALKAAAQNAADTVAHGEAMSQAGALGQASLHDVVHSVIAAELTVQAVTAIRDRAVQAYQELLRMPV